MAHVNFSKTYFLRQRKFLKKQKSAICMDLWKYGQILPLKKCLIIKQLRLSENNFYIWVYHLVLHYIFESQYKIWDVNQYKTFPFCDVSVKWLVHIFEFQKSIIINKWVFYQ
jgi:hypothetical protein